jgi:hypothetical protein
MGNLRERVVEKSVNKAFELLWKEILKFWKRILYVPAKWYKFAASIKSLK